MYPSCSLARGDLTRTDSSWLMILLTLTTLPRQFRDELRKIVVTSLPPSRNLEMFVEP